jgi:methionyl-tRNA formyltransferase
VRILEKAKLDYILSIHFPYMIPPSVLAIPRVGTLNLHPSYLPYNRGWHTPSWSIIHGTPFGATLHWVDESLDSGDIAMQTVVDVLPEDTADSLYQRVLRAEVQLMRDALPRMLDHSLPRRPQHGNATEHRKADLRPMQQLRLSDVMSVDQLLRRLRGLTTNRWDEAPYFERNGVRYRIRVEISREPSVGAAREQDGAEQDSLIARLV